MLLKARKLFILFTVVGCFTSSITLSYEQQDNTLSISDQVISLPEIDNTIKTAMANEARQNKHLAQPPAWLIPPKKLFD
ncbi:hypothetical protein [Vibrio porteresiae]|uniref:Uncharacterized protein n=1 Tax=Vibrio porteresiae DSM 19223 TaxID=1123496 RepID=A0ABZ0QCB7_9VIBR|nr:hypothetical protein [Vibrio porteresiae]WPC73417.1 hypothetical protein R8Z52_15055 [Vibrio porteresiae DSM 19223]